jgi:hypothetical protein
MSKSALMLSPLGGERDLMGGAADVALDIVEEGEIKTSDTFQVIQRPDTINALRDSQITRMESSTESI